MKIPTVNEILEAFHYQASEFQINREYPTKSQMQDVRKKMSRNLTQLPCLENDFSNFKWSVLIVKPQEYADSKRLKINLERLTEAVDNERTALLGWDPNADPSTVTEATVSGQWTPVTNNSPECQLPVISNPGRFVSDVNWNDTRRGHEKEVYNQNRERYETKEVISQAVVQVFEEIFGKERWADLNTGNVYDDPENTRVNKKTRKIIEKRGK